MKDRLHIGWDELVIEVMSAHYNLDKATKSLSKKEVSAKEQQKKESKFKKKGSKNTRHNV